jgi:hypothetical protein
VARRELDVNHLSFLQSVSKLHYSQYTRTARFSQKIVGALLRQTNYTPNPNMILYLNSCRRRAIIDSPEDLLVAIANYKTTERRPYMHSTTLWNAMANTSELPKMELREELFVKLIFEEIFYVWTRLELERPRLPMGQAIILIVTTFDMSDEAKYLVRFIRKLKCEKRRERYFRLFHKCLQYIKQDEQRGERFQTFNIWQRWANSNKELCTLALDLLPGDGDGQEENLPGL